MSVGDRSIKPPDDPAGADRGRDPATRGHAATARRAGGALLGWLAALLAIVAGGGWLYLLDRLGWFDAGPHMASALPLEDLAGHGSQPLVRLAVAWVPVGATATLALMRLARIPPRWSVAAVALLAAGLVFPLTAALTALTLNERVSAQWSAAFTHGGPWAALSFVVIGSALTAALAGRRRGTGTGASGARARGHVAA